MSKTFTSIAMYSIGLLLTKATSLFMLPFLARTLSITEIGRLEYLASISAFAGLITGLAMHEALYRFAGESSDSSKRKSAASEFYSIVWISSVLFLPPIILLVQLATSTLPQITFSEVFLLISGLLLSAPLSMSLAWLRVEDKVSHFVCITLCGCLIQIGIIVLTINLGLGVPGILFAAVFTHFLQLCTFHIMGHLKICIPNMQRAKTALKYTLPIAFSSLIAFGLNGAEKWLITLTSSLDTLAAYAISTKLALAMCILVQPFNMWWMGKRFHCLKHQGADYVVGFTHTGIVWIFMLSTSLLYAGPLLITLFLPVEYASASLYLIFPLSCALMKEVSELVNVGLLYRQHSNKLLTINIRALCVGACFVLLFWNLNIWGILFSLVIAQGYKLVSIYTTSQKLYPLSYKLTPLFTLFGCYLALAVISTHVETDFYRLLMSLVAPLLILSIASHACLLPQPLSLTRQQIKTKLFAQRWIKL